VNGHANTPGILPSNSRPWREYAIQAALLIALLAVAFPNAFFRGEYLSAGDILYHIEPWSAHAPNDFTRAQNPLMVDPVTAFHPDYSIAKEAIAQGEWPLWNHMENLGVPLLANCQSAVLYPPRLVHAFLDIELATSIYILLKLWLCGMTAYVCARGIGLGTPAARFFSVAWMLCGYNLVWAYWPLPDVSAWLPILFLGAERIIQNRYRSGLFLTAFGGALILLAGHPETAFSMALGLAMYFFIRLIMDRRSHKSLSRPLAAMAMGWTLALMVSAPQILPFLEYLANSSTLFERQAGDNDAPHAGINAAAFFVPKFFGAEAEGNFWGDGPDGNRLFMIYPGIAVWILAAYALACKLEATQRRRAISLLLPSILGALLTFSLAPFDRLLAYLPFSAIMPTYHITFALFALPLLAAHAIDKGFEGRMPWRRLAPPAVLTLVAALFLAAVYALFQGYLRLSGAIDYVHWQLALAAFFAIISLAVLVLARKSPLRKGAPAVLMLILAADLLIAAQGLNPTQPAKEAYPETNLIAQLQQIEPSPRIGFTEAGIPAGIGPSFGLEDALGYDGLYPARVTTLREELGEAAYTNMEPVFGTAYYLRNSTYPQFFPENHDGEIVAQEDGVEVVANPNALPRAFVVPVGRVIESHTALFAQMKDPAFNPAKIALLEGPMPESLAIPNGNATGTATVTARTSTSVHIEATTSDDAILVLSDAYYPGWKATIDGAPTPIIPAYHAFRAIVLPEGAHTVTFQYRPTAFYLGLALSLAAMVGPCCVTIALRRRAEGEGVTEGRRQLGPSP
jgi:hypothetical protein